MIEDGEGSEARHIMIRYNNIRFECNHVHPFRFPSPLKGDVVLCTLCDDYRVVKERSVVRTSFVQLAPSSL